MGDVGDTFNALRAARKEQKAKHGIDCPGCAIKHPKRDPTRMLPGQKCRVCGYVDRRSPIPGESK